MKINFKNRSIFVVVIFLSLFFVGNLSYAQTWTQTQDQIKENTQQIKNINEKITDLKDNYRLLYDGAKNQNDQLGNLISYSGYLLAILGLILAWYINRQYEKIKEMKDMVGNTKKYIDEHNKELYIKIKRDETLSLLERLMEVPEDITNICDLLLSRDLLEEDFLHIKEAYLKIKNNDISNISAQGSYITLLLQHFTYESLKDEDIRDEIILSINTQNLHSMFQRDIKNLFCHIFKYLKEFGVSDEKSKTIIKNLFYYYSKSKFLLNNELKEYIKSKLIENGFKNSVIASIAKEKALNDNVYILWIDSIFS